MRIAVMVGALAAALMLVGTASAAEPVACDPGKAGAKLSRLGTGDFIKDIMLQSMLSDPMKKGAVSLSEARRLTKDCDRGDFLAGKSRYRAYGQATGKKNAAVRYALPEDGKGPIAYLVSMADDGKAGPWILAVTDGDEMLAYASVDVIPSDADLRTILAGALDGRYPRTVGLNIRSGGTTMYVNADSLKAKDETPPRSSPEMPKPPPGTGAGSQVLTEPDGVIFKAGEGGSMIHSATGFACPQALNGYRRGKVIIFDAAENGRDVACQLTGRRSWLTVYLTKVPDSYSAMEVFSTYSEQARATVPSKKDLEPPWTLPKTGYPAYADFWVGPKDEHEGLWVMAIGPWYVKMRVTYEPEEEGELVELAQTVAKQITEQIRPPEI